LGLHDDEIKIIIYGKHFAWIDRELLNKFDINVDNRTLWIKEEILNDFSISIDNRDSIDMLDMTLKEKGYKNKSEWLRERIRIYLKQLNT
jgi:hypothetical protein